MPRPKVQNTKLNFPKRKRTITSTNKENTDSNNYKKAKRTPKNEIKSREVLDSELKSIADALDADNMVDEFYQRNEQLEELNKHLKSCVKDKKSVSVYVCGPSGVGKTSTLQFLRTQPYVKENFIVSDVDCFAFQHSSSDVYKEIIQEMGGSAKNVKSQKDFIDKMKKIMKTTKKPALLILNHVDSLNVKNQDMLYTLFQLTFAFPNGQLSLIAVGNIVDFVDRYLPRLSNRSFKPAVVSFPSYGAQDLIRILEGRLSKVKTTQLVLEPAAVQLLGRKIASVSGDARVALEFAKDVIEKCVEDLTKDNVCTVKAIEILPIIAATLSGTETEKLVYLDHFPLHQKLMIVAVLLIIEDKNFDRCKLNIYEIEKVYRKVCDVKGFMACHASEFINLFSLIESTGMFSVSGKRKTRNSKVTLNWDEHDIRNAFQDKTFIGTIFDVMKFLI